VIASVRQAKGSVADFAIERGNDTIESIKTPIPELPNTTRLGINGFTEKRSSDIQ
jgi:hypothetical protein